ncbi:TauD/TfdA family dioxygenase [Rhodovulum sulfidophilum]|uniref:TauD/TfdA family dioxygenase n=1 Tax=Rhodovulum sulfidophilum TaxID=35806 RepID=UPI0013898CB0|nr:TauD/TfdA family dioxygenase [Rhodovulum sulfidophilum]
MHKIERDEYVSGAHDVALWSPQHIDCIASALINGRGIALIRGLQTKGICTEEHLQMCGTLGSALGNLIPQDAAGNLVRRIESSPVRGLQHTDQSPRAFGSRSNHRMALHSDSADIVGLFCIRQASEGGASSVVSSKSIFERYSGQFPSLVSELRRGFYFDMTGKTSNGVPVTKEVVPVFNVNDDSFMCTYNRKRIEDGAKHLGQELTSRQIDALDAFDAIAEVEEFVLRIRLIEGDLLFLNNRLTLHGRDSFVDAGAEKQGRLLLRFWVNRDQQALS